MGKINAGYDSIEAKFLRKTQRSCRKAKLVDLLELAGLGYSAEVTLCSRWTPGGVKSVADLGQCIVGLHECRQEEMISVDYPRAAELLALGGVEPAEFPCLVSGANGEGQGVGDPPNRGQAAAACQKAIGRAASKLAKAKLKRVRKCALAVFKCLQNHPGEAECMTRAQRRCTRQMAKFSDGRSSSVARFRATIAKACGWKANGMLRVQLSDLLSSEGLGYGALAGLCSDLGVEPLGSFADLAECLMRHHTCRLQQMLENEIPRVEELVALGLGQP